ncbi:hypothetical protein [Variovorax sp. DAIF25]|uniref:hypothetical protein n=1 Tax=Variovorax sp. DAIF25 TaxID=3080983 RepID=UPI003D6A7225
MYVVRGSIDSLGAMRALSDGTIVYEWVRFRTDTEVFRLGKITVGHGLSNFVYTGSVGTFALHQIFIFPYTTIIGFQAGHIEEVEPIGWLFGPGREAIHRALQAANTAKQRA